MPTIARFFFASGAISGALAVVLGAFGAHGLRNHLTPSLLAIFQTGSQYHFYHSLGLVAVGVALAWIPDSAALRWAGWMMIAGILCFSGALYVLAITGVRVLGAVAPIGGTAFIIGWVLLAAGILKAR